MLNTYVRPYSHRVVHEMENYNIKKQVEEKDTKHIPNNIQYSVRNQKNAPKVMFVQKSFWFCCYMLS